MNLPAFIRQYSPMLCALLAISMSSWTQADGLSIQSNNFALQNTIIQSANSGSVSADGQFNGAMIQGGDYNSMSVSASGVSVSASNMIRSSSLSHGATSSTISGMSIATQNSGAISASGSFQGGQIIGAHNSMSVQAAGSSVTLSNVQQ